MSCFPCWSPRHGGSAGGIDDSSGARSKTHFLATNAAAHDDCGRRISSSSPFDDQRSGKAHRFTFRELAAATRNFKESNLLGEGGFGKVFKGRLESGQVVAIKQLNREGLQGSKEFIVEVLMLIVLRHSNLVNLIGFCADGDERLLVYEYMPQGSLESHLCGLHPEREPLGWNARVKIALGAAKGLAYLHDVANPPVIYRDLKSANILLDDEFNPKLSDFGLAKFGPVGDNTHVSTRVMGTYGYCAPEYAMSGKLTTKSDVYSFGVVLLELVTGRKAFDCTKGPREQSLVSWSQPFLSDRRRYPQLADPSLQGQFPGRPFHQLVVITSMCLQEQPHVRPIMRDVVVALKHVASQPYKPRTSGEISGSPWRSQVPLNRVSAGSPAGGGDERSRRRGEEHGEMTVDRLFLVGNTDNRGNNGRLGSALLIAYCIVLPYQRCVLCSWALSDWSLAAGGFAGDRSGGSG